MKAVIILGCFLPSLLGLAFGAPTDLSQKPLSLALNVDSTAHDGGKAASRRKLNGRFLHITDMHPDPFYKVDSNTDKDHDCHRGHGHAGIYGAEVTECDSPMSLLNATFTWVQENLKDNIDFIVWTGDSARHDNDEKIPRSEEQVIHQNQMLVDKFHEVFGVENDDGRYPSGYSVPIIPSIGNNDMLPHNIFDQGPNKWTRHYAQIWRPFIPEEQRHGFDRGGWFYVEVVPNKLAVFSLNTMYFFTKNSAVDGCTSSTEPGYEHLEWLRIQLQFMRERGVKAILTGHVPPARIDSKVMWDETCWQKFALWNKQYRDVIVGALYGHVNIEHFVFQDFDEIDMDIISGKKKPSMAQVSIDAAEDDDMTIQAKAPTYLNSLRELWSRLPSMPAESDTIIDRDTFESDNIGRGKQQRPHTKKSYDAIGGQWAERFSLSLVSASVVPNYLPTLRVFEYNITGLEDGMLDEPVPNPPDTWYRYHKPTDGSAQKKPKLTIPTGPSNTDVPGPAYSPQTLSWLGYMQYFANITKFNGGKSTNLQSTSNPSSRTIQNFHYQLEYDTRHVNDSYHMQSGLEVRKWLKLAKKIGNFEPLETKSLLLESHSFMEDGEECDQDEEEIKDGDILKKNKHKKNKHHKKHHKKHKKHKKPRKHLSKREKRIAKHAWRTFVVRGTASTISKKELKNDYGTTPDDGNDSDD